MERRPPCCKPLRCFPCRQCHTGLMQGHCRHLQQIPKLVPPGCREPLCHSSVSSGCSCPVPIWHGSQSATITVLVVPSTVLVLPSVQRSPHKWFGPPAAQSGSGAGGGQACCHCLALRLTAAQGGGQAHAGHLHHLLQGSPRFARSQWEPATGVRHMLCSQQPVLAVVEGHGAHPARSVLADQEPGARRQGSHGQATGTPCTECAAQAACGTGA